MSREGFCLERREGTSGGVWHRAVSEEMLLSVALGKIGKDRLGQKHQEPDGETGVAAVTLPSLRGPG